MRAVLLLTLLTLGFYSCSEKKSVRTFLDAYNASYQNLYYASAEAEWAANTKIVDGDTITSANVKKANEALANFTGSVENINSAKTYLKETHLTRLERKQLEAILYNAANNPQTIANIVKKRIESENKQSNKLYGFDYKISGKSVTTNEIDGILSSEKNLNKRLTAWESSKEVGTTLKEGLIELRDLRNKTVQALGYDDYFSYQVSDYGMNRNEMMTLMRQINNDLKPLFRELHTFARYELAKKFEEKNVPEYIPAHWLPNRWGQGWGDLVKVDGFDLDGILGEKDAEWIMKTSESFYTSLGFEKLPQVFWDKSSLYPLPKDVSYKKNNHASAWHLDLKNDVRSLMSVEPNARWYETTHHELGHIYYYISYTNKDVPLLLRGGANRAYHEAMGSLLGLASMQKPYLEHLGLVDKNAQVDNMQHLLKEALDYVVFIPWSSGVMTEFEHDLYAKNLSPNEFNKRWWELKKSYQGIVAPSERGENFCDATSKTHINDDAAQYYDYAMSYIILFQLHDHIAKNILKQDPRSTNYYGNQDVGKFLFEIMKPGASKDWRAVLKEYTGEDLSAKAMLSYFEPLMSYLKEKNKGRNYTL